MTAEVTFLGGADEIGASCALVDMDGFRLMVDCGQRMGAGAGLALPDFSALEFGSPIDAVLLTHAHADHIGALPALESHLPPDCPIYCTEATLALMKVMLEDSVQINLRHRQADGNLPLFPPAAVPAVLERCRTVRWTKATRLADTSLRATWYPSGHILGAGSIEIRSDKTSILFSGDLSIADQLSVVGAFAPSIKPNLLVLESTYGNRLHAHRPTQERLMVERVRQALETGGHVLFPTFALGRAQEVLLLLGKAMREGELPPFPIWGDGLVRGISKVYFRFPEDLGPYCRRLWEQNVHPIFPDDLPIKAVRSDGQREAIARGEPCVVVCSSGMLQGGASQFYAKNWIGERNNLILITGYQDEESPGQALLNLATATMDSPRYFKLGGVFTPVRCDVRSFQLSAHADNGELVAFANKLQPRTILLVHGDAPARNGLARSLMAAMKAEVLLPRCGDRYEVSADAPARRGGEPARPNPLAQWPPWDPETKRELSLQRFHHWLARLDPPLKWVTIDELAEIWRAPEPVSDDDMLALREAVYESNQSYFVPDTRRPSLLRLTPLENLGVEVGDVGRMTVEHATAALRLLLPLDSGLLRFGFFPEEGVARLEFQFPKAARVHYVRRFGDFVEKTGWKIEINHDTKPELLIDFARQLLGSVSLQPVVGYEEATVTAPMPRDIDYDDRLELAERFEHKTGFHLAFAEAVGR